jgi:phytanoyl-CoA hydroxylase
MNTHVTAEQIQSYQDNGFIVLEDFLTDEELEYWREAVDGEVEERRHQKLDGTAAGGREDFYGNVFLQLMLLSRTNEKVHDLFHDPELSRMVTELAQVDGIRLWHDQALYKEPWANPTSWHFDCPYWSFNSQDSISIWVALDDATIQNGCMYYIPGSHKVADFHWTNIGQNMGEIFQEYPEFGKRDPVPAPVKAGGAALHNGLTAHAAGPNMTSGYRRAMTCGYMPDGATYNGRPHGSVLSKKYIESLEVGDLIDNDDCVPLLYSKS